MMCSNLQAWLCNSESSTAKVSLNSRSASRCRRTTSRARRLPPCVNWTVPFCNSTSCNSDMRPSTRPAGSSGKTGRLPADPDLLEQVIEADLVVARDVAATIGGVDQRAGKRMSRSVLRGIEVQASVGEFDTSIGLARNVRIVRNHEDGVPGIVQLAENL